MELNNSPGRFHCFCSILIFIIFIISCGGGGSNAPPDNTPPTANAGGDQVAEFNSPVVLDGRASSDSDGNIISYSWIQTAGISVTLNDADTSMAGFTAPGSNTTLTFSLMITDNDGDTDTDTVRVVVQGSVVFLGGLDARPDNMNCIAPDSPGTAPDTLDLVDVFPNLPMPDFPLGMYQLPENNAYFYIFTRNGQVLRFVNDPGVNQTTEVLTISVDQSGEGGLLGMAFHPQVATNGAVYFYYTTTGTGTPLRSVISRFTMIDEATIDPGSEQIILQLDQPFTNHNGGTIAFGPDGYLYIGLGDGGSGNDPLDNGQNTDTLLGSMLRVDVDPVTTSAPFYSIPPDNPFVSGGGLPEIYAYGLRNPFRWSFDTSTGILWLADVGQSLLEEVDHIVNGGNYGWADMEGSNCRIADCSSFVAPIHDYPRSVGTSITGGFVYRGTEIPGLVGSYVFGDYGSGTVFTLNPDNGDYIRSTVAAPSSSIVSFGQDSEGEIYVLLAFPADGRSILKIQEPAGSPQGSNIPLLLSQSGCFDAVNPSQPYEGLIPYSVISQLWSDGAQKNRWIALPDIATIDIDSDGDFDFPAGTVLAKQFSNMGVMIETRLFMRHQTGWAGYSYKWRDDQSDADLLSSGDDDTVLNSGLNWHFPSSAECMQCHTLAENFALGPEILQLNHDFTYPQTGRTANQVVSFNEINVFNMPPDPSLDNATIYALEDNSATLEQRVKSYMHSNCSQCHQPMGTGGVDLDFRFETPLEQMNICDISPVDNLGNPNARLIAPGSPGDSVIIARMQSTAASGNRMPPLATSLVDGEAVTVFTDWVSGIISCP